MYEYDYQMRTVDLVAEEHLYGRRRNIGLLREFFSGAIFSSMFDYGYVRTSQFTRV